MKTAILEARGLTKSYGERLVVDHLDLSCRRALDPSGQLEL